MAFTLSSSALLVGLACFALAQREPTVIMKDDKNLRRLEPQNSAVSTDTDEAAVNTLRNLLVEEDRLLRYLDPPEGGDYTPFIQKRRSVFRRSCLNQGVSCDARPNHCCKALTCRCNPWGTNCRCQHVGFLQRLG